MATTQEQLNARLNPQPFNIKVPTTGLFRGAGTAGQLFKREGDKITQTDIVNLLIPENERTQLGNFGAQTQLAERRLKEQYGIDIASLPEVNIGDLRTSKLSSGQRLLSVEGNFTPSNQLSDINQFLGVSPAQLQQMQQNTQRNQLATPQNLTQEQQARYTELVGAGAPQDAALNAVNQITPKTIEDGIKNLRPPENMTPEQQKAWDNAVALIPKGNNNIITTDTSTLDVFTFDDPQLEAMINSLPVDMQGVVAQLYRQLEKTIESGQKINPDIEFTPERLQEFLTQAETEIEPYYQEVMEQNKQDIELSLGRLSEDYKREIQRAEEPFKEGLAQQSESEAQAGLTYGSERGVRERQTVEGQQRGLDDVFRNVERGVQDTVRAGERTLGSSFLSGLQTPQFSPFTANTQGFQQGSARTLATPQGGLLGELPKEREVNVRTRASEIQDITRRNRILDFSPLT